jgi:AbrB family looped-hinge helix DNA binding protein
MELAKVTLRGQITIPIEIRKKLGVKDGDKVIFIEENGRIVMENSVRIALKDVQDAFRGEAERTGLKNEDDVVAMIKEIRKEKRVKVNASNA